MRRVFLLTALFVVIFTGCNSMRSIKEEVMISHLDEEQALKLRNEAVERYHIVFGEGGTECSSSINERLVEDGIITTIFVMI
ncbi:hypothetical protein [Paenibacillus aceti]|nr:hypothetical protein [Paenibacillus aceti]